MSRSFGPGSPIAFKCSAGARSLGPYYPAAHQVVRTGRTRPRYRGKAARAIGLRQMHTAHEYRCSCGHTGWSTHGDLLRHYPLAPEATVEDLGQPHRYGEGGDAFVLGACRCGLPEYDRIHSEEIPG